MPIDRSVVATNIEEMSTSHLIEALVETARVDEIAHALSFAFVQVNGQAYRDALRAEIDRRMPVPR